MSKLSKTLQAERLAELEAELPEEEVKAWREAFNKASKPMHWDPEKEELAEI